MVAINMDMPEHCGQCSLKYMICGCCILKRDIEIDLENKPKECPLIEIING